MMALSVDLSLSLNEVDAGVRKAAKGAGYPWSLASVAGQSARGLVQLGVNPIEPFVELFRRLAATQLTALRPLSLGSRWNGRSGLCPITCAASLMDLGRQIPETGWALRGLLRPVLLVPAVADTARLGSQTLTLSWSDGLISIGEDGAAFSNGIAKLALSPKADIHIHRGGTAPVPGAQSGRLQIAQQDWAEIEAYAARTYAPATEASRRAGAGAGLTDND